MKICLIAALARNHVIGRNNKLPWYLPNDLQYFKSVTMGKPILMGRNTFDSIGKPLPGRLNIVITRNPEWQHAGVKTAFGLEQAISVAESQAHIDGCEEIMIIGGEQIYRSALPLADRLYLTEVDAEVNGDAYFPEFNRDQWREVDRVDYGPSENNPYPYSFVVLDK